MALSCKNCGGNITLDMNSGKIVCNSCGVEQTLSSALSEESANYIYLDDGVSKVALSTYKRALSMMSSARTENSFAFAAEVFEEIPGVLNADFLAKECREKAKLFRLEQIYSNAVLSMESGDPAKIKDAIQGFKSLGEYKDAAKKIDECLPLLNIAQKAYQEKLNIAEQQKVLKQKQAVKRKFIGKLVAFIAVLLIVFIIIGHFYIYSSSNIKISLSPDVESFVTEEYNSYVFHYDVKIENTGLLDVSSIEGTVVFENKNDNEILVDTTISFYNSSSAVVRSKKNSKFTWELTVYSQDTALALYKTDFDDLKIQIDITKITYTNGKTKTY
jgi:hypothetical protein